MLKIRRPLGRLIFSMGIAIPGKTVFLIETAPGCGYNTVSIWSNDDKGGTKTKLWRHQIKTFPCHWPFVRGIHRSPVNSPHKGQCREALKFSLICAWTHSWVNNRDDGDLQHHRAHYDVTVMNEKHTAYSISSLIITVSLVFLCARLQAIIWTKTDLLPIRPSGLSFKMIMQSKYKYLHKEYLFKCDFTFTVLNVSEVKEMINCHESSVDMGCCVMFFVRAL